LITLVSTFDAADISYMIVGSYSSNFYGIPRSTKDADVVLQMDADVWARLPALLPPGIELEQQGGFEMVTATRRDVLRVKDSLFEIELFHLSEDEHDRARFSRRRKVEIVPRTGVWLPTPEDVVVQKLRWAKGARRSKDYADALAVLQVQGNTLDWPYIERWCAAHDTLDVLAEAKAEAAAAWED
jgi:hypothetical protein